MENAERTLQMLQQDENVRQMENFVQHGKISTYEHCKRVTDLSRRLNRRLHLNADEETLVTGAMLHDFYLYDWHSDEKPRREKGLKRLQKLHGFEHPKKASENARKYFNVNKDVQHVIDSHMWPLTLTKMPRTREAWIVCLADKWASLQETLFMRR